MQGYRKGCNCFQANKIRALSSAGKSAADISNALKIEMNTVEKYIAHFAQRDLEEKQRRAEERALAEQERLEMQARLQPKPKRPSRRKRIPREKPITEEVSTDGEYSS